MLSHPVLQESVLTEAMPGSIRKADYFLTCLRKLVVYLKKLVADGDNQLQILSPLTIMYTLQKEYMIE